MVNPLINLNKRQKIIFLGGILLIIFLTLVIISLRKKQSLPSKKTYSKVPSTEQENLSKSKLSTRINNKPIIVFITPSPNQKKTIKD